MLPDITVEDLSATLDAVAEETLDRAGIVGPPVDAAKIARALGIAVAQDDRQRGRGRYVRLRGERGRPPRPTILLRPEPRFERRQWALAHEIGEHLACRVVEYLGVDSREVTPEARETVANQMAGRLLLPGRWFPADAAACRWDLLALKSCYATASHEMIARRMLELPSPAIVSIFDQRAVSFRRSNVPGQVPPPSPAEVRVWRAVHQENRPQAASQGAATIQGWPVHEDGWKREILRTEVADAE